MTRPWEVTGTREIPEWEREILERLDLVMIPRTGPEPSFRDLLGGDYDRTDTAGGDGPG
jgi:hypothetical protein